jgi:two-component system, OmpR family, sensor histidine kinase VicK
MHRSLERQIKKSLPSLDLASPQWGDFLKAIDQSYRHFDEDRKLISRSLDLSSKELVEVNEKIAKEKAKDDIILESIGDALIITDEKGQITLLNKSAGVLLNCPPRQAQGQKISDIISVIADEKGTALAADKQPIALALSSGNKNKIVCVCLVTKKDGGQFLASIMATPYILNQTVAGAACIIRDVTKEKEIDRAKSEFVSLASHQLRTPLSTIGWYTEMLLAGDAGSVSEEQKRYLEEIYHGNRRMVELVNALLNVSRIELGTFTLVPEMVDLPEVARSVIQELAPFIRGKELVVKEDYQKNLTPIPADAKLVRIIFQNIITNAVKYTPPEGQISVSISLKKGTELQHGNPTETYVFITFADTGYGIPKNQEDKIFTKLFRADNVREKETDGTGLGLYLVKSVLEACGGAVWFDSEENKGTTFYVIIPQKGMQAKQGQTPLI